MSTFVNIADSDLPLSPHFIDFVANFIDKTRFSDELWANQISESLSNPGREMRRRARARLERLVLSEDAQRVIATAYQWFQELLLGDIQSLSAFQNNYSFTCVVGVPRTGGSYLTAQLFSSLGILPTSVPAVIAHDGFPDAQPFVLGSRANQWVTTLMNVSEFLTMVGLYYPHVEGRTTTRVPKKLTKGIYAGGLFHSVLGPMTEYIVTIRHPISSCISTYEKSGGYPADGLIKQRSNIEVWIKRDLQCMGIRLPEWRDYAYFDAYIKYWEHYYITLAMCGLLSNRSCTVVPYQPDCMEDTARLWHMRSGRPFMSAPFLARRNTKERHPTWEQRSNDAIQRVSQVWRLAGLVFPIAAIQEGF